MKLRMELKNEGELLSEVALGRVAPDSVIVNGTLFNVFTGEFIKEQSIWIKAGMIAYVGPDSDPARDADTHFIDANGMVLLPGLIDGHTHVNRLGIEEFIRHVIPSGCTTVVMETSEFGMVAGTAGIGHFAEITRDQPIRLYYTAGPVCGLLPSTEARAPSPEEVLPFLRDPRCLGLGEVYWGNMFIEGSQGDRVRALVKLMLDSGKRAEGHTAGATGKKLQAYTTFGFTSCHEPITEEEVLERLRLGYWTMIRQGSVRKELDAIHSIFKREIDFRRMVLVTDSVDPYGLIEEGYLDASLRTTLKLGVPPHIAYPMVTLNAAEHFRLDHFIGSLSPGKAADLVLIPGATDYFPQLVMGGGRILFQDGTRLVEPRKVVSPDLLLNTVRIKTPIFSLPPRQGKARVMELVTRLVTRESIVNLDDPEEAWDTITVLAMERFGTGKTFAGLLKGFGLERGAYGSTMTWDTTDLIVVGCDLQSIHTVIGRLRTLRGGAVYAVGDQIAAEIATPYCGYLSLDPLTEIYEKIRYLEAALKSNGVRWEKPCLTIDTLTTPAIPHLRITHEGYVRLKDHQLLPIKCI